MPLRVTIVSGFLGSGKTTLLRRLLRAHGDLRLGVIVNDMSDLEVDGDLLRTPGRLNESRGNFASIHAGSISGSQRDKFASVLEAWQGRTDLDHLIVETSGSTHPWPVVEEISRHAGLVLDSFVTLIDAKAFMEDYRGGRALRELSHPQAPLMRAQVELAGVILLTKTEQLPPPSIQCIAGHLTELNPHASLYAVTYGGISPDKLLGTGTFDLARAEDVAAGWSNQMDVDARPGGDLGSTVIVDPRPLHPQRLWTLFRKHLGVGIHRSKGFIWLVSRDRDVLLWNQAAGSLGLELTAFWKAALVSNPDGRLLPEEIELLKQELEGHHPVFGDRRCELTVIGPETDRAMFVPELRKCFCTDDEIAHWLSGGVFEDPWPKSLMRL
jgi:G3E family GTPase